MLSIVPYLVKRYVILEIEEIWKIKEEHKINFDVTLLNADDTGFKDCIEAFEMALKDMTTGLLPLGGMTTKGHGIFTGKYTRVEK